MKTQILSLAILLVLSIAATSPVFSQAGGTIKGTVVDKETGEPVPFASVYIKYGDDLIGSQSDFDGNFTIKPVPTGTFSVTISCIGFGTVTVYDVSIHQDKITFLKEIALERGYQIPPIDISANRMIDPELTSLKIIEKDVIESIPNYGNINQIVAISSSDIQVSDDGDEIYFRGSRSGDALYIIDGMRMVNPGALCPSLAIGSMQIYTGGVPAKYGDFTGGVIVIETQSYFEWLAAQESERLRNGGY